MKPGKAKGQFLGPKGADASVKVGCGSGADRARARGGLDRAWPCARRLGVMLVLAGSNFRLRAAETAEYDERHALAAKRDHGPTMTVDSLAAKVLSPALATDPL